MASDREKGIDEQSVNLVDACIGAMSICRWDSDLGDYVPVKGGSLPVCLILTKRSHRVKTNQL
jgi:hypothetical protein